MSQRKSKSKNNIIKGTVPFANRLPSSENTQIKQVGRRPDGKVMVLRGVRKANSSVICYYELFCTSISPVNGWIAYGYQFYAPTADSLKRAKHALQIRIASKNPEVQLKDSGNLQRPKINAYVSQDTSDLRALLDAATLKAGNYEATPERVIGNSCTGLPPRLIDQTTGESGPWVCREQVSASNYRTAVKPSQFAKFMDKLRNFFLG